MAGKINIKRPDRETYQGWKFVLGAGAVLALVATFDQGGFRADDADGSTGCVMTVRVDQDGLNLRDGPGVDAAVVDNLANGERVDATTAVQGGFRQLEDGSWASDAYLAPEPGSTC